MTGPEMALLALTLNVYAEARGEPLAGQLAVAEVTINRTMDSRWPSDVPSVVLQRRQFSWTGEAGVSTGFDLISYQSDILKGANAIDLEAYRQAERVARKVLDPDYKPRYHFTHFHTKAVKPLWSQDYQQKVLTIGFHKFYYLPRTK